jgi:selenide,water dikinase
VLRPIANLFDPSAYPDLLIGLGGNGADDAAVWRLDDQRALIVTTDFFTPVVDAPYDFGAIAAANSLSDVYAMGGQPFLALNIAAFPPDLPPEITGEILRGGAEKVREAGAVIAGGHTVQDKEPKYGLVVIGFADPARLLTKGGARPGDILYLSKPLGIGTLTTALKRGVADPTDVSEAIGWMKRLNREAAELAVELGLQGATDITGYSLLGHGWELAQASNVGLRLSASRIPFVRGARRYAQEWIFPGGTTDNRLYFGAHVRCAPEVTEPLQMLLFDAQTSGGLLLCVPPAKQAALLKHAAARGLPLWEIGEVTAGDSILVEA